MRRKRNAAALAALLLPLVTLAAPDGNAIINSATSSLKSMVIGIIDMVSVVITIICAVGLCVTIGKWMISEHEAKDALLKWGSGFILGVVLLSLVRLTV